MSDAFVLKSSKKGEAATKVPSNNSQTVNADDGYVKTKWREERIWIEAIEKENKSVDEWQEKWAFLADYDPKGNLKEKEKFPDRVNMFSDKLPSSFGHVYGHRLQTGEAKLISTMEHALSCGNRKRRNNDLICYD